MDPDPYGHGSTEPRSMEKILAKIHRPPKDAHPMTSAGWTDIGGRGGEVPDDVNSYQSGLENG